MNHGDSEFLRIHRGFDGSRRVLDEHLAVIGLINAGENFHQSGFAGAVFTHQCMNFPCT